VHFFCIFGFWGAWSADCCTKSAWPVLVTGLTGFGGTSLTGFGNCPDRFVPSVGTCSGGVCICSRGALVCFSGLCSFLGLRFVSDVSSHCPCLRGPRLVFFMWSCSLPFLGFRSIVRVSFYSLLFFFPFLSDYEMCVLSMHSSRGRLRTMCGSRTGGWSLPGVMSDWQCCVDWFLVKYCKCRLRLDSCWCRWRTSAQGRCRWGLQVWRRQVGLVQGTGWSLGSSTGRMVARTVRWSRGQFLCCATKPRSSRDFVGTKLCVVIDRGYVKFAGFAVVHQKTIGLLGWATKTRPKIGRGYPAKTRQIGLGSQGVESFGAKDTHRDRKACVNATEVWLSGIHLMVLQRQIPKVPLVGVYPSLGFRGILVFQIASI
jgi:hypothetical protein